MQRFTKSCSPLGKLICNEETLGEMTEDFGSTAQKTRAICGIMPTFFDTKASAATKSFELEYY